MNRFFPNFCIFCPMLHDDSPLLYRDHEIFSFYDIKSCSAVNHILVCPVSHIPTTDELTIDHIDLIKRMKAKAIQILREIEPKGEFRFGFHEPPMNTVNHLHLHGFILPFENEHYGKYVYGENLTRVEEFLEVLRVRNQEAQLGNKAKRKNQWENMNRLEMIRKELLAKRRPAD